MREGERQRIISWTIQEEKKRKERPIKRKSVKRWLSINTRESLMKRHSSHTENDPKYPQRQGIMKNQRAKQR